jgi:hypothetical protein
MVNLTTGLLILFWLTVIATLAWIFVTAARSSIQPQAVLLPKGRSAEPDTIAPAPEMGASGHVRLRAGWSLQTARFEEHA